MFCSNTAVSSLARCDFHRNFSRRHLRRKISPVFHAADFAQRVVFITFAWRRSHHRGSSCSSAAAVPSPAFQPDNIVTAARRSSLPRVVRPLCRRFVAFHTVRRQLIPLCTTAVMSLFSPVALIAIFCHFSYTASIFQFTRAVVSCSTRVSAFFPRLLDFFLTSEDARHVFQFFTARDARHHDFSHARHRQMC